MSQEVSGEELGVTLLDCIRDGRAPRPEEMSFPAWQRWRKREGRRPTRRQDGRGMSTVEEVALWRAVTAELYGEDRIEDLEEEEEQDEEEEPEARPRLRPIPALERASAVEEGSARPLGSRFVQREQTAVGRTRRRPASCSSCRRLRLDPGRCVCRRQLSAWSVLTGGRQGDLLFGSADRGRIVRPDRQEAIQRLGPLNRSFSQSSQGGLTGPGVKQYLSVLAAHSARYQGKAPAASTASSKGTAARAVYDEPAIPPTVAEFRTEQVRERAGAPRAPPARSAKAGASEAPPTKKAGAIEVRPIAPPASTATATASGRGTDPPADWKGLIDKTALLAAAVGPGFEERTLREHDQNKYRFLLADHQYHPYYLEQRERAAKERAERESSRGSAAVPEEDDESAPPPLPAPAEPPTGYVSLDDEESVEVKESGEEEFGGDDDSFYPDDRGGGGGQPLRLKSRSRSRSRSGPVEPVRAVVKPKATPPWRRPGGVFGPGESWPGQVPGRFPWSRNTKRVSVMRRSNVDEDDDVRPHPESASASGRGPAGEHVWSTERRHRESALAEALEELAAGRGWDCRQCGGRNVKARLTCYKCSRAREGTCEQDSSDEDVLRQFSRKPKKRGGRRHPGKGDRKKRSRKKVRRPGFSSRKGRNKKAHAEHGNQLNLVYWGTMLALIPLGYKGVVQIDNVVEDVMGSVSVNTVLLVDKMGSQGVALVETMGLFLRATLMSMFVVLMTWCGWTVSRKCRNKAMHRLHGNMLGEGQRTKKFMTRTGHVFVTEELVLGRNVMKCTCKAFIDLGTECQHIIVARQRWADQPLTGGVASTIGEDRAGGRRNPPGGPHS